MNFSSNAFNFFSRLLLIFMLAATFACLAWHASYTHFDNVPDVSLPDTNYKPKRQLCIDDCKVLNYLSCGEWIDPARPKLCEFTCDTLIDYDRLTSTTKYSKIFHCIENAGTKQQVEECQVSCSGLIDL